ncbi:MAG TPA: hypothetical protein VKP30_15590 [Polyangiaceae bacterium]|nr:hypothetical protein [Polyangiaceae bacterium]
MKVRIVRKSASYAVAVVNELLVISIARGQPITHDAEIQGTTIRQIVEQNPGTCAWLCYIEPSSPKPSDDFQSKVNQMLEAVGPKLGAAAYVIEGKGARNVFVRMIMTRMTLIRGVPQATKYFEDAKGAEAWLRNTISFPTTISVQEAVKEVQSAMTA